MSLFDVESKPLYGNRTWNFSKFDFYNRSRKKGMDEIRAIWNELYDRCDLPQDTKTDICSRFRSTNDAHHRGALFELFVYSFLKANDFGVRRGGLSDSRNPDFMVRCPDGSEFALEVTCVIGDEQLTNEERFMQKIHDALNGIKSKSVRVFLRVVGEFENERSLKPLVFAFTRWLREQEQLGDIPVDSSSGESQTAFEFSVSGLQIVAKAYFPPKLLWDENSQL